jgi:hypothetical protein
MPGCRRAELGYFRRAQKWPIPPLAAHRGTMDPNSSQFAGTDSVRQTGVILVECWGGRGSCGLGCDLGRGERHSLTVDVW